MKQTIKRILSSLLSLTVAASVFTAVPALADSELVYSLTADDYQSDMTKYGMSYNSSSVIWSVAQQTNIPESVYTTAIRFSTRSNVGDAQLVKHTFANDSVNTPETFSDGIYTLEAEFAPLYKNNGYIAMTVYGSDGGSADKNIAQLRFTASSNTSGTAYFSDANGNPVSGEKSITPSVEAGKYAAAVYYVRYEFDFDAGTYSAWLDVCKNSGSDYSKVTASDDNLMVDGAPLSASGITALTAYSFDLTESTYTNGIWFNSVSVSKSETPVRDDDASIIKRAQSYLNALKLTQNHGDASGDLTLPAEWTDSVTQKTLDITWSSSDESVYGSDGVYNGEERPEEDKSVTMRAEITLGEYAASADYVLTVKKYSNEVLLDYEDFTGKTVSGNSIEGWEFYDSGEQISSHTALSLSMNNGQLVITKNATSESNYTPRFRSMYRFKRYIEKYSDETRTETYQTGFSGRYKVVANVTHGVSSNAQFQLQNIAVGENGASPNIPFQLCISDSKVYEYISGTEQPDIYPSSISGKEATFTYVYDTNSGKVSVQVNGGKAYDQTITAAPLQGLMFIQKEQAKTGDYIKIRDIALYSLDGDDSAANKAIQAANSILITDIAPEPEAVTSTLTLPTSKNGASITWQSSDTNIMDDTGYLIERPFDGDEDIVLTAEITSGTDKVYKKFYITVPREDDPNKLVLRELEKLTYDTITSENRSHITKDLTLPTAGAYGAAISWSSSNPEYISDSGKVLKRDENNNIPVIMTATASLGGVSASKTFSLVVYLDFKEAETPFYTVDLTSDTIASNIKLTPGSGSISQENGKIVLRRSSKGSATGVSIYPQFGGKQLSVAREFVSDVDVTMDPNCRKVEIIFYDKSGNRITTLYTTARSSYTLVYRNSETAAEYHDKISLGAADKDNNYNIKLRVRADIITKELTLEASINGGAYKTIADKIIRENASSLDYIQINNIDDTAENVSNTGTLYINNVTINTAEGLIPYIIDDNMGYSAAVTALKGYVSRNIALNKTALDGTSVSWISSNPELLSADGELNRDAFTEDTPVTLNLNLTVDRYPGAQYSIAFPLIARYVNPANIAFNTSASTEDCSSYAGHGPEKAIDGMQDTSWYTLRSEPNPKLVIDLGQNNVINGIELSEAAISGRYNITGWKVELSRDKKTWTTVAAGATLGTDTKAVSISPTIARYARFAVTSTLGGNCGLNEFALILDYNDKARAEADILLAVDSIGSLLNLTKDVNLPSFGIYGSALSYSSGISSNFSNTGKVTRGSSTVTGTLTITASNGETTAASNLSVSVLGTSSSAGSPGGAGGTVISSGSSGGSSSIGGTAFPSAPVITNDESSIFTDMQSSHWAYAYVKALKSDGIISGDEDGAFRPSANVSREEFVKMLVSAFGISCEDYNKAAFADIPDGDWCEPYVAKAYELGIVNGVSSAAFGKGMPITRQDMAVMAVNACSALGRSVPQPSDISGFADYESVSAYAVNSVGIMREMGVISGYAEDNTLRPSNNASRAEAAVIIYKLIK